MRVSPDGTCGDTDLVCFRGASVTLVCAMCSHMRANGLIPPESRHAGTPQPPPDATQMGISPFTRDPLDQKTFNGDQNVLNCPFNVTPCSGHMIPRTFSLYILARRRRFT